MRKIFFLLSCFMACISANADVLNRVDALQNAKNFIATQGLEMRIKSVPFEYKLADQTEAPLYIYEDSDGTGFVVVSSDDHTETILGYSENETFDSQNIPANMQGWLDGMSRQVAYAREHNLASKAFGYHNEAISPLLTCRWGQDFPFNNSAPTVSGQRCPIGCLATATAQIMYYHRWPLSETTSIPAYTTSTHKISRPALPPTTFDWNAMQDYYDANSTNTAEIEKLMKYVSQSVQMNFAPEGSGASEYYLPRLLPEQYGYNNTIRRLEHKDYSISQWDEIIYNELKNARPVLYCGYTPNWEGHAFVCDGYDGNGFYHINWGWSGVCDGYFRLSVLNPQNTTSTGAASTDDGFTEGQTILVGLQKDGPDNSLRLWTLRSFTYSQTKGNALNAQIMPQLAGTYEVSLADYTDDESLAPMFALVQRTFYKDNASSVSFNIDKLPQGKYNFVVILRKKGDTDWIRAGSLSQYAEVAVNETGVESVIMHPVLDYEITNVSFPRPVIVGKLSRLDIDIKNNADEFTGNLYVFAGQNGKITTKCGSLSVAMMSGEEYSIATSIQVSSTTNLSVFIASDEEGKNVIYERSFPTYSIAVESSKLEWDPTSVTVRFKNNTAADYTKTITASIYQEGVTKALATIDNDVEIPANGTADVVYSINFNKAKKYYITFKHLTNEITTTKKSVEGRVNIEYDPSGIDDVVCDSASDAPGYNLSGQRINDGYRGIIIRNGKKLIRK